VYAPSWTCAGPSEDRVRRYVPASRVNGELADEIDVDLHGDCTQKRSGDLCELDAQLSHRPGKTVDADRRAGLCGDIVNDACTGLAEHEGAA